MTQQDFLQSLESRLQYRGVQFSRAALQAFMESAWPLITDNPDADHWAREFVEAGHAMMLA